MDQEIIAIRMAPGQTEVQFIQAFMLRNKRILYADQLVELLEQDKDFFFFSPDGQKQVLGLKSATSSHPTYAVSLIPFFAINDPLLSLPMF